MKALTLTQPWATLVAVGAKRFETRSWWVDIERGGSFPVAIHAAKGLGPVGGEAGLFHLCSEEPFRSALQEGTAPRCEPPFWPQARVELGGRGNRAPRVLGLPRGAIVAVCDVIACYRTEHVLGASFASACHIGERERAFGDYGPGRYAWQLRNVRALAEPIPCRGALGLWNVPADLLPLIESRPREGEAMAHLKEKAKSGA